MFQKLALRTEIARRRHCEGPFAAERDQYLQHCASLGAAFGKLRVKSTELLWAARLLPPTASSQGVGMELLLEMVRERTSIHKGSTTGRRLVEIARPWLRYLGWWREPVTVIPFQDQLDGYVTWMRDERGFSASTIQQWQSRTKTFLQWCSATNRRLFDLRPSDIDHYLVDCGTRWSRISISNNLCALRVFLRYLATQGACDPHLSAAIRCPRIYKQESLPFAPTWSDVQRMLASTSSDRRRDVRDRAILMLLAIYGMRAGEVASLRLDQVDWSLRVIRLFRLKRREAQAYPLIVSVSEALARYIDTVRPKTPHQEIFIGLHSPRRPLTRSGIYHVVSSRFLALGVHVAHQGPHTLRHACAARLISDGLTLKEIGDHLGHRSTSATSIYAKVNLPALREVGDFDLGDLS
jgi:integrase/recombinase XerD